MDIIFIKKLVHVNRLLHGIFVIGEESFYILLTGTSHRPSPELVDFELNYDKN